MKRFLIYILILWAVMLYLTHEGNGETVNKRASINAIYRASEKVGIDRNLLLSLCRWENGPLDPYDYGDKSRRKKSHGLCQVTVPACKDVDRKCTAKRLYNPYYNAWVAGSILEKRVRILGKRRGIDAYNLGIAGCRRRDDCGYTDYVNGVIAGGYR